MFTLVSQTENIFILSRKTLYESCAFTSIKLILSLSVWQVKWIVVLVLHDTVCFPSWNAPYVFFWFCLISVSVMDVENWMPYARNNHGKAKCRGYVMSLFIQIKPACLPFCLYCCTNRPYCLIDHNKSYVSASCRINTIYIITHEHTPYICVCLCMHNLLETKQSRCPDHRSGFYYLLLFLSAYFAECNSENLYFFNGE